MTVQLPMWRGPTAETPVEHPRAPWLATVGGFAVSYLVVAAIAASRCTLFVGDEDAQFSNWVYGPVLEAAIASFALAVLTLLPFASSRLPLWARAALVVVLAVATVPAVAVTVVDGHSRETLGARLMDEARALAPLPGATVARGPSQATARHRTVAYLLAPDVEITWRTSTSACEAIAAYTRTRPGWLSSRSSCAAVHRHEDVTVSLAGPPVTSDDHTIRVDLLPND